MPLRNTTLEGTLTIGGISLNPANGAWGVVGDEQGRGGLVHLWAFADVRGKDRVLPGATGVIPYQRRTTVTRRDLRLLIAGDVIGETGAAATDAIEGLATNYAYLYANVVTPVDSSTGTRSATLTIPGQSPRTADVHVLGLVTQSYQLHECGSIAVTTLQLSIPSGRFE